MPTIIKLVLPGLTQLFISTSLLPFRTVNYLITPYYTTVSAHFHDATPPLYAYAHPANINPLRFISDTLINCTNITQVAVTLTPLRSYPNNFTPTELAHYNVPNFPPPIVFSAHPFVEHIINNYGF
jgi:hypothetical protein